MRRRLLQDRGGTAQFQRSLIDKTERCGTLTEAVSTMTHRRRDDAHHLRRAPEVTGRQGARVEQIITAKARR